MIPPKSTRGKYISLCVDIALVSLGLAVTLFSLTWMTYAGRLDEAVKLGTPLAFVILALAWPADRLWKSILRLEPEVDPLFKKKHRKFTSAAATCVGAVLGISFLGGILLGRSRAREYARDREINGLLADLDAQKTRNAEFRKRMKEIRSVQPSTYEGYYQQCLALESLLNQSQRDIDRTFALVDSFSQLLSKYPELRGPQILAAVQFRKDMDDKDAQFFAAVREEISKVKELERLPELQRSAYYNREILPVLANEQRLANEENAILARAQVLGIQIPSDLSESLKKP